MATNDTGLGETQARSEVYRLLASGFLYPNSENAAVLAEGSFVSRITEVLSTLSEPKEVRGDLLALRAVLENYSGPGGLERLQAEYLRLFSGGLHCPHHETDYAASTVFMKADLLADIAGFYRAFGLDLSEENRERVDFIGVELEFMHYLAFKEAYATQRGDQEKVELCRDAQRKFLQDHLGTWVGAFQEVTVKNALDSFYAALARLVRHFVEHDAQRLRAEPVRVSFSPRLEPDWKSDGCSETLPVSAQPKNAGGS